MNMILIGAGSRGMTYGTWAKDHGHTVVACAELRPDRLAHAARELNIPRENCCADGAQLLSREKMADAAIIATMDRDHYGHVMAALDRGYHILLEKPISPDPEECLQIEEKANALGLKIVVCHVLRYTDFFGTLKEILDSGELGRIIAIKHSENIGCYHMAHSFVRGNWRNTGLSSPIIMQKSCHDLDILLWLTGSHCTRVASFGSLTHFRQENAPAGSANRCCHCAVRQDCAFDAWRCYQPILGSWPADVVCLEQTEQALAEALEQGPYGRCVYRCDNDVCDHMSTILEFENGITATFSLTAQTSRIHRNIHIMCERGEILADDGLKQVTVHHFPSSHGEIAHSRTVTITPSASGHGGGDSGIMEDFVTILSKEAPESRSSISRSIESHLMACAIEESRLTGKVVNMDDYRTDLISRRVRHP